MSAGSVCGQPGHIGHKCRQVVNFLAESIASPAVGSQPSWAHVVKGGKSVVPPAPPPPAPLQPLPITVPISTEILKSAKASLKAKPKMKRKMKSMSMIYQQDKLYNLRKMIMNMMLNILLIRIRLKSRRSFQKVTGSWITWFCMFSRTMV